MVELIDYDKLSPETRHQMKIAEQRKVVRDLEKEKVRKDMEKARNDGKKEMAKKIKENGLPLDMILKYSALSKEEIEKL